MVCIIQVITLNIYLQFVLLLTKKFLVLTKYDVFGYNESDSPSRQNDLL